MNRQTKIMRREESLEHVRRGQGPVALLSLASPRNGIVMMRQLFFYLILTVSFVLCRDSNLRPPPPPPAHHFSRDLVRDVVPKFSQQNVRPIIEFPHLPLPLVDYSGFFLSAQKD